MSNYNKLFNQIALQQGIEIGSGAWVEGGLAAYSGQTGSHPAYGWKHDHLFNDLYVKKVLANYGARRMWYTDEKRQLSYEAAGRPIGWKPEDMWDLPDGQTMYMSSKGIVKVSGPDLLHFHIGPLGVVYDNDIPVDLDGMKYSSKLISGLMIYGMMASIAGQIRGTTSKMYMGDRGVANILKASVTAAKRACILAADQETIFDWLVKYCLPFYEKAPGHATITKGYLMESFQVFNGLYWILPAFYDAQEVLPDGELKERIHKVVVRLSKWILEIHSLVPNLNTPALNIIDQAIKSLPEAPDSILKYVQLDPGTGGGTDWSLWAYRAARVAAKVLNEPKLDEAMVPVYAKFVADKKYDNKPWLVDADGNYA